MQDIEQTLNPFGVNSWHFRSVWKRYSPLQDTTYWGLPAFSCKILMDQDKLHFDGNFVENLKPESGIW